MKTSPWRLPPLHDLSNEELMLRLSSHRGAVLREIHRRICERETRQEARA